MVRLTSDWLRFRARLSHHCDRENRMSAPDEGARLSVGLARAPAPAWACRRPGWPLLGETGSRVRTCRRAKVARACMW